ncbi:hypothetical protein, partial [Mesorhizobium sp. M1295]|uniref:hypothetical protein n=1 Tax=Mesorhizobium sp. M1295 TaxID=2957076 RepID=UPI00333D5FD7
SQGVHLFWWTPHASEHSTAKGAGKFALTVIAPRGAVAKLGMADMFVDAIAQVLDRQSGGRIILLNHCSLGHPPLSLQKWLGNEIKRSTTEPGMPEGHSIEDPEHLLCILST